MVEQWTLEGADGQPILGNVHGPSDDPVGVILIAHGFKGYKDYGMFPRLAATCAGRGLVAHRFNFSHSGMTASIDTFERPDLFEADTWNRQVFDFAAVIRGVTTGAIAGRGLPFVLFGHSRGGVSALLTAGRRAGDPAEPQPSGVVTAAAPSTCCSLTDEQQLELMQVGHLVSPSSRTGQALRVGRAFLAEQRADPAAHDLPAIAARIACPVLVIHGENDPTVPAACAAEIGSAVGAGARVEIVPGADHVFNTPNPLPDDVPASEQLTALLELTAEFAVACCE